MLTSSANQYLRPEYLSPLPTTLDAKKSPLALLAQTCSQIGADSPNTKSLLPPLDKSSKKNDGHRDKASPASSVGSNSICDVVVKSSFKPYESSTPRDKSRSPEERASVTSRVRTPVSSKSTATPPVNNSTRCNSAHSATSPRSSPSGKKTPVTSTTTSSSSVTTPTTKLSNSDNTAVSRTVPSPLTSSKSSFTPSIISSSEAALKDFPLSAYKGSLPVGYPSYPGLGSHFPMDLMASHQHLKAGLNPYMSYARMKTPSGVDTLVPVCRDPYCTGCQLSSHLLASSAANAAAVASKGSATSAGACPGGCAQCDHVTATSKASFMSPGHQHSAAAAAYAHAQLAALAAASQLPYVCSWIAGDAAYCGKRFSNSEELLQHLRTHTNLSSSAESNAALSMLSHHGLPPSHPLFHRTYPTPPLSPLAAARYHPYSKPPHLPPSLSASSLGFPLHPHPGIPPYFSPYSLYGQRLGAASGMHP